MRVALLYIRDERPHDPDYQAELDALNDATVATVRGLGWEPVLIACGGLPVQAALEATAEVDVVVIMGGEDVTPYLYGGRADYPGGGRHEPDADAAQIAVVHAAIDRGQPLLGLCRGVQIINVALGGSLVQHLPTVDQHRGSHSGISTGFVGTCPVLDPDAGLPAELVAEPVLCSHHQAVDRPGSGLKVAARAADGVIEAVVHETAPVIGVQWHPEHPDVAGTQLARLLLLLKERSRVGA
ncbi:MAG: gamma-glutamyl-gamma-aminobutyrate hydrolase family protein [Propioniciclava sp.]|uniref:gamma-glutamyl-gamma-aminobutyrate hydrolase family protein n=1 Tax=Propioniciclava sp. TaxID=2038686 RepID=UPI0039E2EFAE